MNIPVNPPAFPGRWYDVQPTTGEQVVREQWEGMSLRDYFAAQAMQTWLSMAISPDTHEVVKLIALQQNMSMTEAVANAAYEAADAMLKASVNQPRKESSTSQKKVC